MNDTDFCSKLGWQIIDTDKGQAKKVLLSDGETKLPFSHKHGVIAGGRSPRPHELW